MGSGELRPPALCGPGYLYFSLCCLPSILFPWHPTPVPKAWSGVGHHHAVRVLTQASDVTEASAGQRSGWPESQAHKTSSCLTQKQALGTTATWLCELSSASVEWRLVLWMESSGWLGHGETHETQWAAWTALDQWFSVGGNFGNVWRLFLFLALGSRHSWHPGRMDEEGCEDPAVHTPSGKLSSPRSP